MRTNIDYISFADRQDVGTPPPSIFHHPVCARGDQVGGAERRRQRVSGGETTQNKTKWPRQDRELILDSDSEIFDFWTFNEKNNREIFCIFCIFYASAHRICRISPDCFSRAAGTGHWPWPPVGVFNVCTMYIH